MSKKAMLTVYSAAHLCVDLACAVGIYGIVKGTCDWITALLIYNFCAFAIQMPLGIIADRIGKGWLFALSGCLLTAAGLISGGGLPCAVVLGVGNSLFHIGAGFDVLESFESCSPLGIFVSPGALGLYLGEIITVSGTAVHYICIAVMGICAVFIAIICRTAGTPESQNDTDIAVVRHVPLAAACMFAVVCIRSFAGMSFDFPWKSGSAALLLVLAVVAGKMLGGVFFDIVGGRVTAAVSLAASAVFLIFSQYAWSGIIGVLLFNFTMPITLYELSRQFPKNKGFSFGMLTFALFIGFLPVLFGAGRLNGILSAAAAAISLLLLVPFVGGKKNEAE